MPRGPEGRFSDSLQAELRQRGAWVYKPPAGPHSRRGVPDLLACYRGRFLALELKTPGRPEATTLQAREIMAITAAGGWASVVLPGLDLDALLVNILTRSRFPYDDDVR
jgi:hypothetical protein